MTGAGGGRGWDGAAVRTEQVLESMSVGYLHMDADWRITYVNAEGERILGSSRGELLGLGVWDRFPEAVGTTFEHSYRRVRQTGAPVVFDAYYPEPLNAWFEVRATPQEGGVALYFLDVTARRRAEEDRALAARRLLGVGEVALALADVRSLDALVAAVAERGVTVLGCAGAGVAVPDPADPGRLVSYVSQSYGEDVQADYARLPLEARLPVAEAARTGRTVLVRDEAACRAYSPELPDVVTATGSVAWASVPMVVDGSVIGVVTTGWSQPQSFLPEQVALLETYASQCGQALQRLLSLDAERAAARRLARMAEGLQRSLLTRLPEPDHLELVARYVPAADEAKVGGDWYDAFIVDGRTCLVMGDVTGHDHAAAISMAQVRNVLRGVAHALGAPPADVLSALDRALRDLAVGVLATTFFAVVEQTAEQAARGERLLRWSNAGHPPALLLGADGSARYLRRPADLLLGLAPDTERFDHEEVLPAGSTLLLFTDGLVERRGEDLDAGLERLRTAVEACADRSLQELCDVLVQQVGAASEDDVALLALRAHPEDEPRPHEAGPERLPRDLDPGGF